jgi:hypothetical protein
MCLFRIEIKSIDMRLKTILQTAILALVIIACNDEDNSPADVREFVPGDLIIGIKSTASISSVFDLMNEKGVTIDQMSGFFNYSTLPNDSLDYINNVLKDKVYLNKRGFSGGSGFISAVDNRLIVTELFFEMDIAAQQDWLATMDLLKLNDLGNDTKNLVIKVVPGTEEEWTQTFKAHPIVTWVELNYIGGFEPMD